MTRSAIVVLCLVCAAADLNSESLMLTTYYPAPSGIYTQMITTRSTWLARDAGNVAIGAMTVQSPAPNGAVVGNLDVNDVYLRGPGQWASQLGAGLTLRSPAAVQVDWHTHCLDGSFNVWRTLDLSAQVSEKSTKVVLRAICGENIMYIRPTGSGLAISEQIVWCAASDNESDRNIAIIPLPASKKIDVYNTGTDCNTVAAGLYVVGDLP